MIYPDSPHWQPYSISFYSDNVRYTTTIHALSDEHAEYVLDDLKDTAIVAGKIIEVNNENQTKPS